MKKILLTSFILCVLFFCSLSVSEEVIQLVAIENPPYLVKDKEGRLNSGIFYQQLEKLFSQWQDLTFEIAEYPKQRAAYSLINNKVVGILASSKSPIEQLYLDYFPMTYLYKYRIYSNKNKFPIGINVQEQAVLLSLTMGVVTGEIYNEYFDELILNNQIANEKVTKSEQNFLKLATGRIDFLLAEEKNADYLIEKHDISAQIIASSEPIFQKEIFLLAISKYSKYQYLLTKESAMNSVDKQ